MSPKKCKVFIVGSSVSRDIFDAEALQHFDIVDYVARSSLASAMEMVIPPIPDVEVEKIKSAFQRRMVAIDLNHALPNILRTTDFDLLLFDAIDERFNVYVAPDGGRCTVSNELLSANFDPKKRAGQLIRFGSDEHFALWEKGWDALIELLAHQGLLHKLIVNKVYWAQVCEDGSDFLPTYTQQRIAEANAALDRLYGYMTKTLPRQQFLQYGPDAFVGSAHHRWGKSPFHFVARTYEDALRQLLSRIPAPTEAAVPESVKTSHTVLCGREHHAEIESCPPLLEDLWIDRELEWCHTWGRSVLCGETTSHPFESTLFDANGQLAVQPELVTTTFSGQEGSYQLRMRTKLSEIAHGLTVRFKLSGWERIKYLAVGYSYENTFRHVKIVNVRQNEWTEFSIGHADLAFRLQNRWEAETHYSIPDVRLYVKGTPGDGGATLATDLVACWREIGPAPSWALGWDERTKAPGEILDVIYEYQRKCFRSAHSQAEAYLLQGECPLYGETVLKWAPEETLPEGLGNVGTYRFSWHALHPAVILLLYARDQQQLSPLFAARDLVASWLDHSYFSVEADQKFAWYDHGTAERLVALLLMWATGLDIGFDRRFMNRLRLAIYRHAQLLASELFYASHQPTRYHNHAWFQDIALMVAALIMADFPCARRWLDIGLARLTDQFEKLIVRDGEYAVFIENSIGYHQGIQRLVEFAGNLIRCAGIQSDMPRIAHELDGFSKFLKYPDGRAPAQGDTFRRGNPNTRDRAMRCPYSQSSFSILPKAGYAVAKGNYRDAPWMLCVFGTSLCRTHKHEDDLSFTFFFDGVEWLIDPSFFSHEYASPIPAYLRSAFAHNVLAVQGLPYSIEPGRSMLSGYQDGKAFFIEGKHFAYENIEVHRRISGNFETFGLEVVDRVVRKRMRPEKPKIDAKLMLQCGDGVNVEAKGNTVLLNHAASKYKLLLKLPVEQYELHFRQSSENRVRGFSGLGFMTIEPTYTIECTVPLDQDLRWQLLLVEGEIS
jgi:hypothetical protein